MLTRGRDENSSSFPPLARASLFEFTSLGSGVTRAVGTSNAQAVKLALHLMLAYVTVTNRNWY